VVVALLAIAMLAAVACSGASNSEDAAPTATVAASLDAGLVGRPQNRAGIGDVERAFGRYERSRGDLIRLFEAQPWFTDGLARDESLFVERSLAFVSRYAADANYIREDMVRQKTYRYEKVPLRNGELELMLIHEPGQDVEREMQILTRVVPALEALVDVDYPEKVMTVVNGPFEINDFNDGQFIRIARCCFANATVLAHELAHTYWSMGPSWFNEGMADIYAQLAIDRVNRDSPPGWRAVNVDLDRYYNQRKAVVESGRLPNITLPRRLASDGLYEVADVLLLDIRKLIGAEAFAAAAREIYLTSDYGRYNLREKRVEDVFLKHARDKGEAVMALFNRVVWGDDGERYRQLQELEGP
jgi:hypothetical protein